VAGTSVISGSTTYRPPLPPYRVGNGLHSIMGWFKVCLGLLVNACSSNFIHGEVGSFKPTKPRGSTRAMMEGGGSTLNRVGS
jgi:hypothetical protein